MQVALSPVVQSRLERSKELVRADADKYATMYDELSRLKDACLSCETATRRIKLNGKLDNIRASKLEIEKSFERLGSINRILNQLDFCLKEHKENINRSFAGPVVTTPSSSPSYYSRFATATQNYLLGGQRWGIDYRMQEINGLLKAAVQKAEADSKTKSSLKDIPITEEESVLVEGELIDRINAFTDDVYASLESVANGTNQTGSIEDLKLLNRLVKLKEEVAILNTTYDSLMNSHRTGQESILSFVKSQASQKFLTELQSIESDLKERKGEPNEVTKTIEKRLQEIKLFKLLTPIEEETSTHSEENEQHDIQAVNLLRDEGIKPNIVQVFVALRGAVVEFKEILQVQSKLDLTLRGKLDETNVKNLKTLQLLIQQTERFRERTMSALDAKIEATEKDREDFKATAEKITKLLAEIDLNQS